MAQVKSEFLTAQAVREINDIVSRGYTAEIRPQKDKIVVYEVKRKLKNEIVSDRQQ